MKESAYHEMSSTENHHWWFVGRRERARSILNGLDFRERSGSAEINVLEVGCGTGGNLGLLLEYGAVTAVEPNAIAFTYCKERFIGNDRLFLLGCNAEQIPSILPEKKFDLVCMFDVLEHLDSPVEVLKILKETLKHDSSCLIVSVPAFQFLWSSHDVDLMHKRRYTKRRLRNDFEAAGFKVEVMSGFNLLFLPLLIALRLLHKLRILQKDPGTNTPVDPLNRVLVKIMHFETRLAQHFILPAGASIFLVARSGQ